MRFFNIVSGLLVGTTAAFCMEPVDMEALYNAPKAAAAHGSAMMHPDSETLRVWDARLKGMRRVAPAPPAKALPAEVDLLPHFDYVPEEHNQGDCGNCWAW